METLWKWMNVFFWFLLVGFCTGFPINLEDNSSGHTQFLVGIAAVLIAVGTIILVGCLCCHRQKGFEEFHNSPVVVSTVSNVDHGHVNPISNGEFTIFTPLRPPNLHNDVFAGSGEAVRGTPQDFVYGDIDVRKWYESNASDFPRVKLKYIRELGNGRFGKVVEGAAQNLEPNKIWSPVVVKILDVTSSPRNRALFLNDALFYLAPTHPNLLALKGRCLQNTPLLIIHESCTGGDLKSKLRTSNTQDMTLQWCCQLTSAVRHLHDHGFIHPDLASRNCLLTEDLTLKLGDYGLSASKYPEDYYKGGEPLIAVRWRSPESLDCTPTTIQPKPLTKEANVWALGVTMWEICENGAQPYQRLDDDEVVSRVFGPENLRLDGPTKPQLYSDYLFRLMRMCWSSAESRPKVSQIDLMLCDLLQVHKNTQDPLQDASEFDQRWESFKPNAIVKTDNYNESEQLSVDPLQFNIGQVNLGKDERSEYVQNDSMTDSLIFKQGGSSGSDTEEENWRRKVERGAYSEKVRLKSRSVADLMVLTHVDYSESETETPMPSLDYRLNRSVRNRSNLENIALNFSSEGNLLNIEHDFQNELKKLQVERRDSLLFVPDKSENNSNLSLLHELNDPIEMKPINQIYNVFNVTIDKFDPVPKLQELINMGDETRTFSRQDSENKSDLGYATLHNSERNSDFGSVDGEEFHIITKSDLELKLKNNQVKRNLPDILASLDESGDHAKVHLDLLETNLLVDRCSPDNTYEVPNSLLNDESQNVPDLYSENVESSDSVNSVLSRRRAEVNKTDVLLPEIKQNFVKGPSIMESLIRTSDEQKVCDTSPGSLDTETGEAHCTYLEISKFIEEERNNVFLPPPPPKLEEDSCDESVAKELKHISCDDQDQTVILTDASLKENCSNLDVLSLENVQITSVELFTCDELESMQADQEEPVAPLKVILPDLDLLSLKNLETASFESSACDQLEATQANQEQTVAPLKEILPDLDLLSLKNVETASSEATQADPEQTVVLTDTPLTANPLDFDLVSSKNVEFTSAESDRKPAVEFDLSANQQSTSMMHFTSTPFGKLPSNQSLQSLPKVNLFDEPTLHRVDDNLNYSLETWDTFLGKSFESNVDEDENFFDSFTSEPQSMVFLDQDKVHQSRCDLNQTVVIRNDGNTFVKNVTADRLEDGVKNGTFVIETDSDKPKDGQSDQTFDVVNKTFDVAVPVVDDQEAQKEQIDDTTSKRWKSGDGWFLHPQSSNDDMSKEETEPPPSTSKDSYIRFGVDDEIMTAIRNELLEKLPQAQGVGQENLTESENWNEGERDEVFLRYNVYNMPLSPIPEECSLDEENDDEMMVTSLRETDSDWTDQYHPDNQPILSTTITIKSDTVANTPSQGSCCSSDTLFDFEELADKETNQEDQEDGRYKDDLDVKDVSEETLKETDDSNQSVNSVVSCDETSLVAFLSSERGHSSACNLQPSPSKAVAPLPSPEDKPWKSLPASLLTFDSMQQSTLTPSIEEPSKSEAAIYDKVASDEDDDDTITNLYENITVDASAKPSEEQHETNEILGILTDIRFCGPIDSQLMSTSFSESNDVEEQEWDSGSDTRSSSSGEFIWKEGEHEESLKALNAAPHDLLEDVQPMDGIVEEITESDVSTTSSDDEGDNLEFVPSAWDKFATPTKSALRSPDKTLERTESKKSKGVWFKKQKYHCVYEYPKEPDSPVLQSQDLWKPQIDYASFTEWEFDVDTYLPPPTTESDLNPSTFTFKPKINNSRRSLYYLTTSINDLQGDGSSSSLNNENDFISSPSTVTDLDANVLCSQFFPGASTWPDQTGTPDSGLEDSTPVDFADKTFPRIEVLPLRKLAAQVLNNLQDEPITSSGSKDVLGGLRHTRNQLKLDLPPSPSAFTSAKTFTVEPQPEPVVLREKPTFSTFGKSRFLVQHVDTPPLSDSTHSNTKNVCFDVLPYRPLNVLPVTEQENVALEPLKCESTTTTVPQAKREVFCKGEANLLDSADEDSGIESSTLERKSAGLSHH